MNNILAKTLKETYDLLWPSFFAVGGFLFVAFLDFMNSYDLDEDTHYSIFFTILIINFVTYWVLFIIQIYMIIKKYFFTEKHQLSFIFYLLWVLTS